MSAIACRTTPIADITAAARCASSSHGSLGQRPCGLGRRSRSVSEPIGLPRGELRQLPNDSIDPGDLVGGPLAPGPRPPPPRSTSSGRGHFRAVRRHPARARADRAQLAARRVRRPQPHARANRPRRRRDVGLARPRPDGRLSRLVRSPRAGIDRLRRVRHRGIAATARAPDRARHLPHRRTVGAGPRTDRRSARRPLRPLVGRASPGGSAPRWSR